MSPATIAVVGAGPRGTMVLERLLARAADRPERRVEIVLLDPHPAGPGRVWRQDQSALMRLNSTAEDVTAFPDASVTIPGPIRTGPTLAEWAALVPPGALCPPELEVEAAGLGPLDFASRALAGAYLRWVRQSVVDAAPPHVQIRAVVATVTDLTSRDGRERLELSDGSELWADAVVLTVGHLDARPSGFRRRDASACDAAGIPYVAPGYAADQDLDRLVPGTDVVVRGLGLAFVDLALLVTEGRGGRFVAATDGPGLEYLPSGSEPRLFVGSRRGVPYNCKPTYRLRAGAPPGPRFLTPEAVDSLLAGSGSLSFRRDVWPLLAREIAWHHYYELFHGHPHRTSAAWAEMDARWSATEPGSPEERRVIERLVPHPVDRFDVAALEDP